MPEEQYKTGAGNESRTRDLNLGKVALYQLSYSRKSYRTTLVFASRQTGDYRDPFDFVKKNGSGNGLPIKEE